MANEFKIKNGLVTPNISVTDTTNSISTSTGALVVAGGVGIASDLRVGGTLFATVTSTNNLAGGTAGQVPYQSAPSTTSFFGPGTAGNVLVSNGTSAPSYNNTLRLTGTTTSASTTTGALVVDGGVGVAENLNVGGSLTVTGDLTINGTTTTVNTTDLLVEDKNIIIGNVVSPDDTNTANEGGITLKGATDKTITWLNSTGRWTFNQAVESTVGIQNTPIGNGTAPSTAAFTTLTANSAVTFTQNTGSTSTTSGTLVVTGGTGISENLYVGGNTSVGLKLTVSSSEQNNGIDSGALQITNGGAYVAGNLYVGGTINLSGVAVQQIGQITTTAAGWNLP
jgi:hypothetical protein